MLGLRVMSKKGLDAYFKSEMLADTLVEHDINNNLKVIPKSE